jgi:glutamine cyclotransferase
LVVLAICLFKMYILKIAALVLYSIATLLVLTSCSYPPAPAENQPVTSTSQPVEEQIIPVPPETQHAAVSYTYKIVNEFPHSRFAFTQGLAYEEGFLYEGTGIRGRSSLSKLDLATGRVLQSRQLTDEYFGEGITIYRDRIIQLTWQARKGFVYDRESFDLLSEFEYDTEGWGITYDSEHLIMSDGSATLYFLDPHTMLEVGRVEVSDDNTPVRMLNELEYIDGQIYANVWQSDRIAIINPRNGKVTAWIDLEGLLNTTDVETADVLNGIACDRENNRLFVTGKLWPKLFEIQLIVRK